MKYIIGLIIAVIAISGCTGSVDTPNTPDKLEVGNVTIEWLGHSTLTIKDNNTLIYTDPFVLPENATKADFILVSHDHFDHCDVNKTEEIQKNTTRIIGVYDCVAKMKGLTNSIKPDESFGYKEENVFIGGLEAYNVNEEYHKIGEGVGFFIGIDKTNIYFAGDTDLIPEMENFTKLNIDVAILPIGGKYTMDVNDAAEAAKIIKPKYVIPVHYNSDDYGISDIRADPQELKKQLDGTGIEVVILKPLVN